MMSMLTIRSQPWQHIQSSFSPNTLLAITQFIVPSYLVTLKQLSREQILEEISGNVVITSLHYCHQH